MKFTIGIDIGGTNTEFGIITTDGKCLKKGKIDTSKHELFQDFVNELTDEIKNIITDDDNLLGIGIGAPNGNYYTGLIEFAPNLRWTGTLRIVDMFREKFNVPVYLTNDANAAAIGEKLYGGAKNIDDFIVVTLGTGVGSGFYSGGNIIYGHDGFAGELGHTIYDENGRQCACGRKGCLETYCSATGIVRTVNELLENQEGKILKKSSSKNITSKMIFEAALENDEIALEAFEITGKILGFKLSDAVAITSPKAIFLFGGLAGAGDLILKPTKFYMEKYLLPIFRNKVELKISELPESNAALLGASALILKHIGG